MHLRIILLLMGFLIEQELFKEQVEKSYRPSQRERELQNLWDEISKADRPLSIKNYDHFTAALLDFANDRYFQIMHGFPLSWRIGIRDGAQAAC